MTKLESVASLLGWHCIKLEDGAMLLCERIEQDQASGVCIHFNVEAAEQFTKKELYALIMQELEAGLAPA